jgi:Chaperone of endosialidase
MNPTMSRNSFRYAMATMVAWSILSFAPAVRADVGNCTDVYTPTGTVCNTGEYAYARTCHATQLSCPPSVGDGRTKADCGQGCICQSGTHCTSSGLCLPSNPVEAGKAACLIGETWDVCSQSCGTPNVLRSPTTAQSGWITVTNATTGTTAPTGAQTGSFFYDSTSSGFKYNAGTSAAPNWLPMGAQQWEVSPSDSTAIYSTNTGGVGIGNYVSGYKLWVQGSIGTNSQLFVQKPSNKTLNPNRSQLREFDINNVYSPNSSAKFVSFYWPTVSEFRIEANWDNVLQPTSVFPPSISIGTPGVSELFFRHDGTVYNGSVGVRTTTPTANLEIAAPASELAAGITPALKVGRISGNPSIMSSSGWLIMDSAGSGTALNYYSNNNVILANGGGNVGIGTTDPSQRLEVAGRMMISGSNAGMWIEADTNNWFVGRSGANLRFYNTSDRLTLEPDGDLFLTGFANVALGDSYRFGNRSDTGLFGDGSYGLSVQAPEDVSINIDANDNGCASGSVCEFTVRRDGTGPGGGQRLFKVNEYGEVAIGVDKSTNSGYGLSAYGSSTAGYFYNGSGNGGASLASHDRGISAYGDNMAGFFYKSATDTSEHVYLAYDDYGIKSAGTTAGGHFDDSDQSGYAYVAHGDRGITASGSDTGGYFTSADYGIQSYGSTGGGYFRDMEDTSSYARLGYGVWGAYINGSSYGANITSSSGNGEARIASANLGIYVQGDEDDDDIAYFENNNLGVNGDGVTISTGPLSNPGSGNRYLIFTDGDQSVIGSVSGNGTTTGGDVMFNTTSDVRLKTGISDFIGALDMLRKIRVRTYSWVNSPGESPSIGFVAQELFEIYPEAVSVGGEDPDTDPWGVDYGHVTPIIVGAVQEQQEQIEALRSEINNLKADIQALKSAK